MACPVTCRAQVPAFPLSSLLSAVPHPENFLDPIPLQARDASPSVNGQGRARGREGRLWDVALVLEAASREGEARPTQALPDGCSARWAWPPGCRAQHPLPPRQAMNTLHELQFAREFKEAVREAYPQLLLALLTQILYLLELNLPKGPQAGQEAQGAATPSPQR